MEFEQLELPGIEETGTMIPAFDAVVPSFRPDHRDGHFKHALWVTREIGKVKFPKWRDLDFTLPEVPSMHLEITPYVLPSNTFSEIYAVLLHDWSQVERRTTKTLCKVIERYSETANTSE